MATNTFKDTSGNLPWDGAADWSLRHVPQAGDDVSITGAPTNSLTVTINAADPAYTVASLTETTTNPQAFGESLDVAGHLAVTGATDINTGILETFGHGSLTLNTVTLSNFAELSVFGGAASLSIASLTAGSGISGGSVIVFNGTATIGSVAGPVSVSVSSGAVTIGTSDGAGFFGLDNGRLNLQSTATTLGDTIDASSGSNVVDLQNIAYQTGETYAVALVKSDIFNDYSITLKSAGGQTLYRFEHVEGVGTPNAQTAPRVTLASDTATGTMVTLACYTADTQIAVPGGEVAVSDLAIGDTVLTASGAPRPVKWIGRRSYAGRFLRPTRRRGRSGCAPGHSEAGCRAGTCWCRQSMRC